MEVGVLGAVGYRGTEFQPLYLNFTYIRRKQP